jgi:hypothetical protein
VIRPSSPFLWISIIFFIGCLRYLEFYTNAGKSIFLSQSLFPRASAYVDTADHADYDKNYKNSFH